MENNFEKFWNDELGDKIVSKNGNNWLAHSPFREDKKPSFSVSIETGVFNDFGDATYKGAYYRFIELKHGLSRSKAKEFYENKYGRPDDLIIKGSLTSRPSLSKIVSVGTPLDYGFVELVEGGKSHALGKIVEVSSIFELDCFINSVTTERHISVYRHNMSFKQHWIKNGNSVEGYHGPVHPEFFHIDLDSKNNPALALSEIRQLIGILRKQYLVSPEDLRVYYSGNKGFHLYLCDDSLEELGGSSDMPRRVKTTTQRLCTGLATFDLKPYAPTSLLRAPNSIHPDTGLFKVPLTLEEIEDLSIEDIKVIAKTQRRI